jgi:putative oxidoreductase
MFSLARDARAPQNEPVPDRFLARHLAPQAERIYAALRIVAGFLFSFHGLQKIVGVFARSQPEMWSQHWFGGIIELVAGTLIMVGLFTRPAAFLASGMMAVAYFQFHWKLAVDERFFPIVNRGELAVLYCFLFLFIAARGAGIWSVDRRR